MPFKLPDASVLGSDDPRATGGLPVFPQEDPGAAAGVEFGKQAQRLGNVLLNIQDERDQKANQINSALASADLETNLFHTKEALKTATDPAKIDELKASLSDHLANAAQTITDPSARELWTAKHQLHLVEAEGAADKQQFKVWTDRFLAGANTQLDEQRKIAVQATDPADREQAKTRIGDIIGSLEKSGVISQTEGQKAARDQGEGIIAGTVHWLNANGDPVGALKFLNDNKANIDPARLDSLNNELKPKADRQVGIAGAARNRPGTAPDEVVDPGAAAPLVRKYESEGLAAQLGISPYVIGVGGTDLSNAPGDPNKAGFPIWDGHGNSHAAGAYQFQPDTWAKYAVPLGIHDFSPASQDKVFAAAYAAEGYGPWAPYNPTLARAIRGGAGQATPAVTTVAATGDQGEGPQAAPAAAAPAGPLDLRAWVDRINADKTLSDDQKKIAIEQAHAEQQRLALGQANAASDLTLAVTRGEAGRPEIEKAYQEQRISPETRTHLHLALDKLDADKAALAEGMARVGAAGQGGAPLDPKSKDDRTALNYHYDAVSKAWAQLPGTEQTDRAVTYSAQYGMVPLKVQSWIRGSLHSGRPDQVALGADAVSRLRNANPQLLGDIGDENDLRLATLIGTYTGSGVAPAQAVQLATDGMKVNKADQEARAADFDAQRGKTPKDREASDKSWIEGKLNSIWVIDPTVDPVMQREFEEIAKAEYQKTGNLEASRQMALDNVNRVWGRTDVGGDRRYMKGAPEKFYGVTALTPGENSKWMNEQLLADVGKGAFADPNNPITADRLRLLPSPDKTRPDGSPVYQVWLAGPTGAWTQVTDPKGAPISWYPNWQTSAENSRRGGKQQEIIDRARQQRQRMNEPFAPASPDAVPF